MTAAALQGRDIPPIQDLFSELEAQNREADDWHGP